MAANNLTTSQIAAESSYAKDMININADYAISSLRTAVKPRTRDLYEQTRRSLLEFFDANQDLATITTGDADAWQLYLKGQGLAQNTIRRRCGRAKQFLKAAVRQKLIEENPFADLKSLVVGNPERFYFVTRQEAQQVIDACPDAEWRLIFALSRFGGLRCPSEHLALRWSDVNWEYGRILVSSPKTEHLAGGESRLVPMFPELRPYLEQAFEQAEPGSEFVITRYRDADKNLRTQLHRIICRAGLKPWPKVFQNLRSTCETELAEQFPLQAVCQWIGNSQAAAKKHYLQVTSEHFERATSISEKALQNPVQQPLEYTGNAAQVVNTAHEKKPESSGVCESLPVFATEQNSTTWTRTDRQNFLRWQRVTPLGVVGLARNPARSMHETRLCGCWSMRGRGCLTTLWPASCD